MQAPYASGIRLWRVSIRKHPSIRKGVSKKSGGAETRVKGQDSRPVSEKGALVSITESGLGGASIRTLWSLERYPSLTGLWTHRVQGVV